MNKKSIVTIVLAVLLIVVLGIASSCIAYNTPNQTALIIQFGEIVGQRTEPGPYFKTPVIQNVHKIYTGEQLYDLPPSEVITSDKKTMDSNSYSIWEITNPVLYYQTLASQSVAVNRINAAVYNATKKVISSTTQDDVINGKDGQLSRNILDSINLDSYGIDVTDFETKQLDLPDENEAAVYARMISERNAIAAQYRADGQRDAQKIISETDASVRETISNAEAEAAMIIAEGESLYFQTLRQSYAQTPESEEFYNFIIGLEAMKKTLTNGGVITITEDHPLYGILFNRAVDYDSTKAASVEANTDPDEEIVNAIISNDIILGSNQPANVDVVTEVGETTEVVETVDTAETDEVTEADDDTTTDTNDVN